MIIIVLQSAQKAIAKAPPTTPTAATPTAITPLNPPRTTALLPAAPLVEVAEVVDATLAELTLLLVLATLVALPVEVLETPEAEELAALEEDAGAEDEVAGTLEVEAPETEPVYERVDVSREKDVVAEPAQIAARAAWAAATSAGGQDSIVQVPAASKNDSLLQTHARSAMLLQLDEAAAVVAQVKAHAGGLAAAATKEATRLTPAIMLRTATIFG